jgi:hypothetical protein
MLGLVYVGKWLQKRNYWPTEAQEISLRRRKAPAGSE